MKISKNKKMRFFLMSQGSLNPKITFLGQKLCSVARERTHTHRQTDTHESEYRGHPFRVSGFFLQSIIKDRSNDSYIRDLKRHHDNITDMFLFLHPTLSSFAYQIGQLEETNPEV